MEFNAMAALERWRETGTPPDVLIANHVTGAAVDRSRPLMPVSAVSRTQWRRQHQRCSELLLQGSGRK